LPTLNQIYVLQSIEDNKYHIVNHFSAIQIDITIKDLISNFNCIVIVKD